MAKGKEVIIGMKRDPIFGPVIVFGLGGIFVEALKDTSMRIAPVGPTEAKKMIGEIKGYKILHGLRGERSVDMDALAKIIAAISKLSLAHPEVKEIDLNPVMVNIKKASVVDARIIR
jgi:acyl-CoA synthetase (NDP forming)